MSLRAFWQAMTNCGLVSWNWRFAHRGEVAGIDVGLVAKGRVALGAGWVAFTEHSLGHPAGVTVALLKLDALMDGPWQGSGLPADARETRFVAPGGVEPGR